MTAMTEATPAELTDEAPAAGPGLPAEDPAGSDAPAETAEPEADRFITLGNGTVVAPARDKEVLIAWTIDALLVFVITAGIYAGLSAAFPDPFSYARELNALAAWPGVALVYGFTTAGRRSIGQRIAGTRTLRIDTGTVPGFWRSGWMMVLRVLLLPVAYLFCLCGGSTFGIKDRHLSIDALATGL